MRRILSYFLPMLLLTAFLMVGCNKTSTDPQDEGGTTNVLVVSNFEAGNAWIDTNFTANISDIAITTIDVSVDTLQLPDLSGIDVVLLYEDGVFQNSTVAGDIVYQYVMAGGNLVIGTFYWQDRSGEGWNGTWGDLEMIEPLYDGSCRYTYDSLGTVNSHPLTAGVNSLKSYYRGGPTTLRNNATAVAWWNNGDPFIAFNKPAGTITMVTTYPAENYYWEVRQFPNEVEGDFFQVWENALKWTAAQSSAVPMKTNDSREQLKSTSAGIRSDRPSGAARDF